MAITSANKAVSAPQIACGGSFRITLSLTGAPDVAATPADVVLVLDRSGSMAGAGLTAMQQEADALIDALDLASDGAGLEDLGKGLRSQVGTMYGTKVKGVRYLEMAEGYVTRLALDSDDQVIGYEFVSLGKMTDFIKKGDTPNDAYNKAIGTYGRFNDAAKYIDPRKE